MGDKAVLRLRTRQGAADNVLFRYVADGEARTVAAVVDEEVDGETWWRAELTPLNTVTRYRWLLAGGDTGYGWLTGRGVFPREVSGGGDFVLTVGDGAPAWHADSVAYEIFPDRFASSGARREAPGWAVPRAWDDVAGGARQEHRPRVVRRRPARDRAAPRPPRVARREPHLPDAVLPGRQHAPLRRVELRPRRPAARRRRRASLAHARGPRPRDARHRRPHAESLRQRARVVPAAQRRPVGAGARLLLLRRLAAARLRVMARREVAAEARLALGGAARAGWARSLRRWLDARARRLAHRRREHGGPLRADRPRTTRSRAWARRGHGGSLLRRRARARLPPRPRRQWLAGRR